MCLELKETPYYEYDMRVLRDTLEVVNNSIKDVDYRIHYALKANTQDSILKEIKESGFGVDCVSGNEMELAVQMGFDKEKILFAGVGKTDKELDFAIENSIGCINCESLEELQLISDKSMKLSKITKVALRLNPNIDAKTHKYISTGKSENKFGISNLELKELIDTLDAFQGVDITGLHFHIGSQIMDLNPFIELCEKVKLILNQLKEYFDITFINVGGGLGVDYERPEENLIPDFESYFNVFKKHLDIDLPIYFELGRSIIAQCGKLYSQVLYVKKGDTRDFAIIDAGMTELLRPALYGAKHCIQKEEVGGRGLVSAKYDIVGPICESSDCFAENLSLPVLKRGDRLTISTVGAYGQEMSLNYNLRNKIASYFVNE
jgi:diaminopimelate decarboxylase